MILDIFSRFVVVWLIAPRESAKLTRQLIADTVARHDVEHGMLTLHADSSAAMRSKPVASLLVDLDVAKIHSRPHTSDDNPYSESQSKTMKRRPEFPERFGCIEDARSHRQAVFAWYNDQHPRARTNPENRSPDLSGVDEAMNRMRFASVTEVHGLGHDRWACHADSRAVRGAIALRADSSARAATVERAWIR